MIALVHNSPKEPNYINSKTSQFVSIDLENAYSTRFRSFEPNLTEKTRKHAKSTKMSQISMFHQYFGTFLRLGVFR